MTPKDKAKELIGKFIPLCGMEMTEIQCALIAVDLAIEYNDFHIEFLQEVKQEIEKL